MRYHLTRWSRRQRDAEPSLVFQYDGEDDQLVDEDTRKSKSALLPFSDPLVRAVAERTQNFQGYDDIRHLESLQVVSYDQSDHFWHRKYHQIFPLIDLR